MKPVIAMSRTWARRVLASTLALALGYPMAASAAAVYRCDDGQASFADKPCGATGPAMAAAPSLTPAQLREGRQSAQREQVLAQRLRSERLAQEASTRVASAASLTPSAPGLNASQQLAPATSTLAKPAPDLKPRKGQRHSVAQRDPRLSFEAKAPAAKPASRKAAGTGRVKSAS